MTAPQAGSRPSPGREALSPLFTDVPMTSDDARAIVAALRDIAETDGVHEEEKALIESFMAALDLDLGAIEPTQLEKMTPAQLAAQIFDPALRTITVQCAVLVAMADGSISEKERARVMEYATALGMSREGYENIESVIADWVRSGDIASIF
jgi:tellurite resistance protein